MKILHLTLKKKWFDMISSGEKKEEYRDLKSFWAKRLCNRVKTYVSPNCLNGIGYMAEWKEYEAVRFARGGHFHHSLPQLLIECKGINISTGNPDWGAEPGKEYFVIKLGDIINATHTQ